MGLYPYNNLTAPIFVPATPTGELAKELRGIVEKESIEGVKFRIVEMGGRSIKNQLQRSNPTRTKGCPNGDCLPCSEGRGKGGNCLKSNVTYEMECKLCVGEGRCVYIGETSRNLYTRAKEHMDKYRSVTCQDSFVKQHQAEAHPNEPAAYTAKVTGEFRDCLSRQVSEAIQIRRTDVPVLNSKSEWHQPALWRVQSEIIRN